MLTAKKQLNTFVLFFLTLISIVSCDSEAEIEIADGKILGSIHRSENGREYFAYKHIPYALPPIGDLRYEPPLPNVAWEGVMDCREDGPICAQGGQGFSSGSENCLHIYVYTPKLPRYDEFAAPLPVLVWFHGGSFVIGSAQDYSPHLMMDRDLILVIPQYRLGYFGFYNSLNIINTGNYGMMDQSLSLEWVKKNIGNFGGDPDQVTIGGDCAGGASTIYHMMSPLSKGLFHRAVSFSGTPLNPWAFWDPRASTLLLYLNQIRCPAYNKLLALKCMREIDAETLTEKQLDILESTDPIMGNKGSAPCSQELPTPDNRQRFAEKDFRTFLTEFPLEALLSGNYSKVPLLLSVTKDVGAYLYDMGYYRHILFELENSHDKDAYMKELFHRTLIFSYINNLTEKEEEELLKYYAPDWDGKSLETLAPGLTQYFTDAYYKSGIQVTASIMSHRSPIRLFRFEYDGGPKLFDLRHPDPTTAPTVPPAIGHGEELFFFLPFERVNLTQAQKNVVKIMLDMIEDYVYGRTPLGEWPQFTNQEHESAVLTTDGDILFGEPFVDVPTRKHYSYLFEAQNRNTLKSLGGNSKKMWTHDEL